MTTIAWDGEILAVDSAVSFQDTICAETRKLLIKRPPDDGEYIIAMGGHLAQAYAFADWIEHPDKEKPKVDEMEAIVIHVKAGFRGGRIIDSVQLYDNAIGGFDITGQLALGTGWKWAQAAMDHGKNAIQAVEYAMTRDSFTGGEIVHWSLKTG